MPCNSDYMNPTTKEQELKLTSQLLVWVKTKLGKTVPEYAKKAAQDYYGKGGERAVRELCSTLNTMNANARKQLIYGNAEDPTARKLADWWEAHVAADTARAEKEADDLSHMRAEKVARAKLPAKTAKALGLKQKRAGDKIKTLEKADTE